MRKLFVLFLLVALVPFTVGCNGLWDFDDDTDPVATSKILLKQALPAAKFAPSAIQDLTLLTYDVVIGGTTYSFRYESHEIVGDEIIVTFARVIPTASYTAEAAALAGAGTADVKYDGLSLLPAPKSIAAGTISVPSTPSSTPVAVTVAVAIPATDVQVPTTGKGIVTPFTVVSVTYGTTTVSQNSAAPTTVTEATPQFNLTFANVELPENVTGVTFTLVAQSMVSPFKKVTLTAADLDFTRTSPTTATIKLKVSPTQNEELVNGAKYSITIESAKVGTTPLQLPGAYYIIKG